MDKRMLNLIIGIGLAIIAIFMIHGYMQQREALIQQLIKKGEILEVLVAKVDIPRETTIDKDMVAMARVPANSFQPGDLTSPASAIGKLAAIDILKNQHINSNMVKSLSSAQYLSQKTPEGTRAMTIPVDKIAAIEGLVKPNDQVDVIATFDMGGGRILVVTLFQGVQVLAMGKNISPYKVVSDANTVTLALRPEDIKLLTYVLDSGNRIRLTLRPPGDHSQDMYPAVSAETLMRRLGMWAPPPQVEEKPKLKIYKGAQGEEE